MKRFLALLLTVALLAMGILPAFASDEAVYQLPRKSDKLTQGLILTHVTKVSQITGEDSPNKTQSRFGVWGTDLGSMAQIGDKVYMFGGDTFGSESSDNWRSNVLFIIQDDDPSDGLTITGAITDPFGRAKELLRSRKIEGSQITVIPTNLFSVGETLYCIYMSVVKWGDAGQWTCDYAGLAKSADHGETWERFSNVKWPGDSNFIQTANCLVDDTMYIWGIPSGRFGGVALMKVQVSQMEDYEKYAYYTGNDESGQPVWVQGSQGVYQAKVIIDAPVGEISVMYNEYLGNFVMTYLNEKRAAVVMREGILPWEGWGDEYALANAGTYPSLYGGYMLDKYVQDNGRIFYFAMSQFFPIYNIMWMKAEFPKKQ